MLDWQDVKALVFEDTGYDGDVSVPSTGDASSSIVKAPKGVPKIGTISDTRLQLLLRAFTSLTSYLRTPSPVQVYLSAGDREVDLGDFTYAKVDNPMCYVTDFWISGTHLCRADNLQRVHRRGIETSLTNGSPSRWARTGRPGVIQFDNPCDGAQTPAYTEGYYYHPQIFYDSVAAVAALTPVAITGATGASPISIHAAAHGFVTGQMITVAGVLGNTAANGTWMITKVGADDFLLRGSKWTAGAYASAGTATPPSSSGTAMLALEDVFAFSRFAGVAIKEVVVSAEASLARLAKFDKQAFLHIQSLRARAIRAELAGW